MDIIRIPPLLKDFSRFFTDKGFSVYLVGGAVRDMCLNKREDDWDVATNAAPEQVGTLFKRVIPTGIEHGTVTIPFQDKMIECTTFRTEQGYTDGRRPDSIRYAATIEEDLSRRDFTMNAIAISLPDGHIIDPFDGRNDIKRRIIRSVGNASERFFEDGLRPLRAVRFASQLDFVIEDATLSAIQPALKVTALVAHERIRDEFIKMITSANPSKSINFMEKTGLLQLILPELQACRGVEQKGMHRFDVLDHLVRSCEACQTNSLVLRLSALFHDIGKPLVRTADGNGSYTFYNHEMVSSKISEQIMERLRFPLKTIKTVSHLVRQHMFHYEPSWTDAAIRRFIVRVGPEYLDLLFALRFADAYGMTGEIPDQRVVSELRSRTETLLAQEHAFTLKDMKINGRDLISIGIPAGPQTGLILNELLETVLEDPEVNSKIRLLEIAREINVKRNLKK